MTDRRLDKKTLFAYALPAAPIAGLGLPIVVYLPPFYAEQVGINLSIVGTVFMITRFWDVITDPIMGVISDKFPSRWGRRRHWIVLSVPILIACVYMVFMPPDTFLGAPVTWHYLFGWMMVLYIGYTLLTISHLSWGAELHPDYNERSRVQGWREILVILGMVTALSIPAVVERVMDGDPGAARVEAMGWFIIVALAPAVYLAVTRVPERKLPKPPTVGILRAAQIVARNKPLQRLLGADLLAGLATGTVGSMFLFLAAYWLGVGRYASLLLLIYFVSGSIFTPLWMQISYRFGKHKALAAAAAFNIVFAPLILIVPHGSVPVAVPLFILLGSNFGAAPFLLRSMIADVADHDEVQSGVQRTGLYYSLITLTNKIGSALAVGILYPILELIGFIAGAENTAGAIRGMAYLYVLAPILFQIALIAFVWTFPIDARRQDETRRILEERRRALAEAEAAAAAPADAAGVQPAQ